MPKDDLMEFTGQVEEVLPGNMFRIKIDDIDNTLTCYAGGKLKQNKIKVILGDRVRIEVSPYDLTKGRVVYRL